MIIAIDGPAASGKGTIARRLAQVYDLPHLDTGLLYRATARRVLDIGALLEDVDAATAAARALDATRFDETRLRGKEMGEAASIVAAMPSVRAVLIDVQRAFAALESGAVLDGRDIGTVICPEADTKIFVTANPEIRAHRRALELSKQGAPLDVEIVLADIRRRDERDLERSAAPLKLATDAVILDTTQLDIEAAVSAALAIVAERAAASQRAISGT